ncbi:TPA: hypothetical protein MCR07_003985 [Klebsiella pneumoniae]|uniref:hypothetical protein n=1 Tax=Klebsiella pneumoniae TaxID=573 RepID=UPI000B52EAEA|nr:hypothetical protein [Klebsiella pneumoniae]EIV5340133.1 hypothetical protein [Klebsiella pneumoniae]EKX8353995.1 hypothetical protein [Klebsiella pneumoniae]OWV47697.1 hypothetical protein CDD88_26345 [Klebsiella pneumoniae]PXG38480.1 hypothetical protein DMP39_21775 [Klebsiella pneumoniae]CAE7112578.1 hypothetical protein AI2702V1_3733 [Klebsiella pneumoniae]
MKNEVEQIALQNDMSIEFVTWFFNEKKAGCGNVWFMMMAAMWEGWKGRSIEMDKLATENVALKGGPQGFFAYGSECGYEEFDTAEEATEFAEAEIADFRDQACDGWSDEVGSVVWGIVMQRASMTGLRPVTEDDNVPSHIEEWCDYTLLPAVETPATDAYLAGIKADGVEEFVSNTVHKIFDESGAVSALAYLSLANSHVKQLREGAK